MLINSRVTLSSLAVFALTMAATTGVGVLPASAAAVAVTIGDITYSADNSAFSAGATVTEYTGAGGAVTIPSTVTIDSHVYPVTTIGTSVFVFKLLTSVSLPTSVTTIGNEAFAVNQLTSVTIPASVMSIGNGAFADNQLTSVTIPTSVTSIGGKAFIDNLLTSLTLRNGLTTIGDRAFKGNRLTSVTIPTSVTTIGDEAFMTNLLTTVSIPTGIATIGVLTFAGNLLTTVTIPGNVTMIGSRAFVDNPLTTMNMNGAPPTVSVAGWDGSFGEALGITINVLGKYDSEYGRPASSTWSGYTTGALYVVGYEANGHGTAPASENVGSGAAATEPNAPTATGFVFDGWFDASTGGEPWDFTTGVTANTTLHAHWSVGTDASVATLATTGVNVASSLTGAVLLSALGFALLMIRRRKVGRTGL